MTRVYAINVYDFGVKACTHIWCWGWFKMIVQVVVYRPSFRQARVSRGMTRKRASILAGEGCSWSGRILYIGKISGKMQLTPLILRLHSPLCYRLQWKRTRQYQVPKSYKTQKPYRPNSNKLPSNPFQSWSARQSLFGLHGKNNSVSGGYVANNDDVIT